MNRAPRGALDEATGEERLFIFIKRFRQKNEKILISANTRNLLGLDLKTYHKKLGHHHGHHLLLFFLWNGFCGFYCDYR